MATATTIERMGEALHLWALAPATVGACCVAADRGRARVPELAAAALMLLAMADAASGTGLIAPVYWAVLLVVGAMALAALRGARRGAGSRGARSSGAAVVRARAGVRMPHPSRAMTLMTALGLIVMAVLMVAMTGPVGAAASPAAAHAHGGASVAGATGALALAGAIAYAGVSVVAAVRTGIRLDRVQYASMAAATGLMALASAA